MLSTAITPLKQDLFNILTSEDTKIAFKNAITSTFPSNSKNNSDFEKFADSFGEIAAKYLGALAEPLSQAIDKYVKQIGIQITIPETVISPNGPCSGIINTTDVKII